MDLCLQISRIFDGRFRNVVEVLFNFITNRRSKEWMKSTAVIQFNCYYSSYALRIKEVENYVNLLGWLWRGFASEALSGLIKLR